jgi:antitoxin (DNA-binding transcriptional repressor) of toxin-antitoxin stability system
MYAMAKRYTVAAVRERLAEALDEAEKGTPVIIERKGVRYRLTVEPGVRSRPAKRVPRITIVDPAVRRGDWTWDWAPDGFTFDGKGRG